MPTANDIAFQYGHDTQASWTSTQIQSGRYVPAAVGILMKAYGYDYFYAIGFWILGFAVALWFCTLEFVQYVKLPTTLTPLLTLAIGFHSFWAERMPFLIGYLDYASGLIGSGLALLFARWYKDQPLLSTSLVGLGIWIAFASYQPMALIPLFAVNFVLIRDAFLEPDKSAKRNISAILPLLSGFIIGALLFFLTHHLTHRISYPTSVTWNDLSLNTFPVHERIFYGFAQVGLVILALRIPSWRSRFLALGTLGVAFLLTYRIPGSLDGSLHRLPLGNMAPTAFFHVGLVVILGLTLRPIIERQYPKWPLPQLGVGALLALVFLSAGNQLSLLMERWWQYEYDYAIASDIVADLRDSDRLREGAKIAVLRKNQKPIPQEHDLFSKQFTGSVFFSGDIDIVPFLNRVSGLGLTDVTHTDLARLARLQDNDTSQVYEMFCDPTHKPWEIHKKEDITLVCLSPMAGKRDIP